MKRRKLRPSRRTVTSLGALSGMSRRTSDRAEMAAKAFLRAVMAVALALAAVFAGVAPASALKVVLVSSDTDTIDLTGAINRYPAQGDRIQVSTAPGPDGVTRRIEVTALETGAKPAWAAFALKNDSDEQLTRLIVAPHFRLAGSGVNWPDLGGQRITTITASQGDAPKRQDLTDVDVFSVTLDPGATVTYVAELGTPDVPQIYLWEPDAYKDKGASLTLYEGIVIGIAGLMALFLSVMFIVRGALAFPAAAALAWSVFIYVCIDFGFWRKIFTIDGSTERIWRAGTEAAVAATLVAFLFAYLNLRRWHPRVLNVALFWLLLLAALVASSVFNAPVAAGVARMSIATVAAVGLLLIFSMALRGSARAAMLIPTWLALFAWVVAAGAVVLGAVTNDLAAPALIGGLVLVVMLVGLTLMQTAFAGVGVPHMQGEDAERRALAMVGSGDAIYDWDVLADRTAIGGDLEAQLGLKRGTLEGSAATWLEALHPLDRDRFTVALDGVLQQRAGRIHHDIRLRGADGRYSWFTMKARPVINAAGEVARVVGSLADVTASKSAEERVLHDAIHDNLTGLPNRDLFMDRLAGAIPLAQRRTQTTLMVSLIDIDGFRDINETVGLAHGDAAILAVARRLSRGLNPGDTLGRLAGDQFGVVAFADNSDAASSLAESMRTALASPIHLGDGEVALTVSIGLALFDPESAPTPAEMFQDCEVALANAKREGGDKVVLFTRFMRAQRYYVRALEEELRRAIERNELKVQFQPIARLDDRTVAGLEAFVTWRHPRMGALRLDDFSEAAERAGLIGQIGAFAVETTARELAAWQRAVEVQPPIFALLRLASGALLGPDFTGDVRDSLGRHALERGSLRLGFTEACVMDNPEFATQALTKLHEIGAGIALEEFGAGFTSLAHLPRYRADMVKLANAVVKPNARGSRPAILRSLVTMARDLNMEVVAESVDTESEAVELAQIGAEFALGLAFGQPLDAAAARKLMGASPQ